MSTARSTSRLSIVLSITLLLAACSGSDSGSEESTDTGTGEQASTATDGGSGESVALDTTPIPARDVYDFRDGTEPVSRTEAVQLDSCPLLSLATLDASSGTYSSPTVLAEATAQRCVFSNAGTFTFSVFVEPAAEVDVDDHSGRAYNIDVEPVVEPQTGPGEKAVILIDTAFADNLDNEGTRYLYFFVLGDQAVTLQSTAFKIQDDSWRALADEVAANLASGAAGGEVETTEVVDAVEPYAFEPCGWVTIEQIAALAGVDSSDITLAYDPGRNQCRWTQSDGLGMSVSFRANERLFSETIQGDASVDRSSELGILAAGSQVIYEVWLGPDTVFGFGVNADSEQWFAAADALAVNLVSRVDSTGL